jgi:outer membrane receptor for ferrienterochelin and colicin
MTSLPRVRHLARTKHASLRLRVALTLALAGLLLLVTARSASPQRSDRAAADEAAWLQDVRLVFSASRYAQDVREAPASVTIITAAEIQRYGYRTLADVLAASSHTTIAPTST